MERLFGLDAQLLFDLFVTMTAVFLLFVLLSYILFDPVKELLKKRQEAVRNTLDAADKEKADALQLKTEYDAKLKKAEREAEEFLGQARKHALKNERSILEEAKEKAGRMLSNADIQIKLEKEKAMDELKQEIVLIAAMMAEKIVGASVGEVLSDRQLEDIFKGIGDDLWQS